ncbi:MAG: carbon starvation protein A [bacterium]|nr:carbon starvation protein A [bacterium]
MSTLYIVAVILIFALAFKFYGRFLENTYGVKKEEPVPSKEKYDGVDYVPTNKLVLLGHHFSSIAGAGPIVGPIIAGLAFGWVPAILWIVLGSIFIGGLHDFSSLIISIRHGGRSIAEVAKKYINKRTYKIFLIFIWLALMYVVAVFLDLSADTFAKEPVVAQVSILYILIAILFGISLYRLKIKLGLSTVVALLLIFAGILFSLNNPLIILSKTQWIWILTLYAFLASILPVWFLLQPRDYLSSYFLYFTLLIGLIGLIFGKNSINYPAFVSFNSKSIGPLIPFMFITIACGAISGFHSLVSSGTTSKQLDNPKNARFVAYGGMLLEGVVAAIALSTVMILSKGQTVSNPQQIYSEGIGKFCSIIGIKPRAGQILGYLAVSAFILTTVDTATRIARYIFQELFEIKESLAARIFATMASLILPILLLNMKLRDFSGNVVPVWKVIWPIFGTTNQLLAALVLLIIYVWVKRENFKHSLAIILPMIFMLAMTLTALAYTLVIKMTHGQYDVITITALILFALAIFVVVESVSAIRKKEA